MESEKVKLREADIVIKVIKGRRGQEAVAREVLIQV